MTHSDKANAAPNTPKGAPSPSSPDYVTLAAGDISLVVACAAGTRPSILHWGARLEDTSPEHLALMATRQHAHGSADTDIAPSLLNELGSGIGGFSGFSAHRAGKDWASVFLVTRVQQPDANSVDIICRDAGTHISVTHHLRLDPASDVLTAQVSVENEADEDLSLDWCTALCLPLDERASELLGFSGRWAGEFSVEKIPAFTGAYVRENKSGRTSHDCFPGLISHHQGANESKGTALGAHLGWSGNSRMRVDRLNDGRSFLQMGEYFFPGEMTLPPAGTYQTPVLYAAVARTGLSGLSQKFHRHLRTSVLDERINTKARPVHYNTWEAVYFNHDRDTLFSLATAAHSVGAERFILDDGWFGGRRNDKAGLGDWWVSPEAYPDGLGPLIEKVTGLGMEFGLWFEPEMVNPASELYRAHPDWVLRAETAEQIPFRGQLVLDLTQAGVVEHLYTSINALLEAHDISYIKWDMNRDVHHPGSYAQGSAGRVVSSAQTRALYALIARLRANHPKLEIESCASGGGRADYGILQHTDRIWISDSNDALDRQRIQRGASHFFPPEIMGAHVGPRRCHITGRKLSMQMRVATAFFGHMGMELNLLEERPKDLETLKAGLTLHKQYRALLHSGLFVRLDTPDHVNAVGVVSDDQTQAIFSWANLTGHTATLPGRMFVSGLDPARKYRTRIIWPSPALSVTAPSIIEAANLSGNGTVFSGEALMQVGLQIPLLPPETCLIFALDAA